MTTETQQYKVGDRVRVTVEGRVGSASDSTHIRIDGDEQGVFAWVRADRVEKLTSPLPTTPGSVVRFSEDGRFAHLNREGEWVADNGGEYSAAAFRSSSTAWNHEVLFDAGASK